MLVKTRTDLLISCSWKVYPIRREAEDFCLSLPLDRNKYLEMGCGTGHISIFLAKQGKEVVAIDISSESVASTRQNCRMNNVHFSVIQSDLYENCPCEKFDIVLFNVPFVLKTGKFISLIQYLNYRAFPPCFSRFLSAVPLKNHTSKTREILLREFIEQTKHYLVQDGEVFLLVLQNDVEYLTKTKTIEIINIRGFDYLSSNVMVNYRYSALGDCTSKAE